MAVFRPTQSPTAEVRYVGIRARTRIEALYGPDQLRKFAVMQPARIANAMAEGVYAREIHELAAEFKGAELIERAAVLNLERSFQEVRRWSCGPIRWDIDLFLSSYDVDNLRSIIRVVFRGEDRALARSALIAAGSLTREKLDLFLEAKNVQEIADRLEPSPYAKAIRPLGVDESVTIGKVEDQMTRFYYDEALRRLRVLWGDIEPAHHYFGLLVDCANLRTAMGRRLRKEPQVDVKEWAIPCGWFFPPENLAKLDKPGTVETGFMENDRLKRFFGDMGQIWNEANPVERLELTLKRAQMIYLRRFAKIYPATQAALLEYFFRKRLEVDAMRLIARAQETRREAEIEKLLIVWA